MNPMTAMAMPRFDAPYLAWNTVASYDTADEARAAVERLAACDFPIENLDVVGSDVKMVDRVTGRMTRGRVARAGALSGMWTGLFVGLMLMIVSPGAAAGLLLGAVAVGAATGAGLAVLATSAAKQPMNGFASVRTFVAARYDLVARNGFADRARSLLATSTPAMPSHETID